MRRAIHSDLNFVAQAFINICIDIKMQAEDIYSDGLPTQIDESTLKIASDYIHHSQAIVLIKEINKQPIACLAAKIEPSSFTAAGIGEVGQIAICWVKQNYRRQSIATELVEVAEKWFQTQGIDVIELSYLAQNTLAAQAWKGLGYTPFRVFSYKRLSL